MILIFEMGSAETLASEFPELCGCYEPVTNRTVDKLPDEDKVVPFK